jgi:hypothetical protein
MILVPLIDLKSLKSLLRAVQGLEIGGTRDAGFRFLSHAQRYLGVTDGLTLEGL